MREARGRSRRNKKEIRKDSGGLGAFQVNTASVLSALTTVEMGIKPPPVETIAWRTDKGPERLFKAAAIARAKNEARGKEDQQKHNEK